MHAITMFYISRGEWYNYFQREMIVASSRNEKKINSGNKI